MIRPTFNATDEQRAAIERTRATWDQRDELEERAWRDTQALRDLGVPDLVICELIPQVSKPTLNRELGPRKAPKRR
ncbi:hypothetical protein O7602_26615 [Micromonospora sp. WMMD1128]|uniref:hypothetical protein n=1 Tax=Micromonospora sp. WMMD1128 TaxID=3015150 RepID=UPI00248BCB4F|nr:hypothetical protein [Micromonospora sp. WMMD1128]WBB73217.1 hypothetical protein O7602_26615 [Micromonospora sp. WMMD1128]